MVSKPHPAPTAEDLFKGAVEEHVRSAAVVEAAKVRLWTSLAWSTNTVATGILIYLACAGVAALIHP